MYELTNLCVLVPQRVADPFKLDVTSHPLPSSPTFTDEIVTKIPPILKSNKYVAHIHSSNKMCSKAA